MKTEQNVKFIDFEDNVTQISHRSDQLSHVNGNRGILMSVPTLKAIVNFVMAKLKDMYNKIQASFQEIKDAEILQPYVQREAPNVALQSMTPNTPPISDRALSNPFAAIANASIERNSNEQAQLSGDSIVSPIPQEIPRVNEMFQPSTSSEINPQMQSVYAQPYNQSLNANYSINNNPSNIQEEQVKNSIDVELYQGQGRREVVEQPTLQTPQEFQMPEPQQDSLVEAAIKLEEVRRDTLDIENIGRSYIATVIAANEKYEKEKEEIERRYKEALEQARENFEKEIKDKNFEVNDGINKVSNLCEKSRNELKQINNEVNFQSSLLNNAGGMNYAR